MDTQIQTDKITLYGSLMCPIVPPIYGVLMLSDADCIYLDIFRDGHAREVVRNINNGYESVPTLVFPDGSTLTEPGSGQLRRKLEAMGYTVQPPGWQKAMSAILERLRGQSQ